VGDIRTLRAKCESAEKPVRKESGKSIFEGIESIQFTHALKNRKVNIRTCIMFLSAERGANNSLYMSRSFEEVM